MEVNKNDALILENTVDVKIGPEDPNKKFYIGDLLQCTDREEMVKFQKNNKYVFAGDNSDLHGVDPSIACHKLNVDPTHSPIGQKYDSFAIGQKYDSFAEQERIVNAEVDRLLKIGFIRESNTWNGNSNTVVVPKINGKYHVCVV